MPNKLRVVFFGELASTFSRLHYAALCQTCEVVLWVAGRSADSEARSGRARFSSFYDWSRRLALRFEFEAQSFWNLRTLPSRIRVQCPIHLMSKGDETLVQRLDELAPDLILSAGFSRILPAQVLGIPRIGAFNCHPAALPRYAGLNPWFWTLRAGETQAAATIHRMVVEPDAGDVVAQERMAIPSRANHQWLYNRSALISAALMKRCVLQWEAGSAPETPQDLSARSWFGSPRDEDYRIDWTKSADEVLNLVRASQPAPGAWTLIKGERVVIRTAEINESTGALPGTFLKLNRPDILVACGSRSLRIRRLRFEREDFNRRAIERVMKLAQTEQGIGIDISESKVVSIDPVVSRSVPLVNAVVGVPPRVTNSLGIAPDENERLRDIK